MATIVVQDDKILRFVQVILDPDVTPARVAAFRDYLSYDIANPDAWFAEQRALAAAIYPSNVRMVGDQAALRAALPDADAVISESLTIGRDELDAAPGLKLVQKFGIDARNIDADACEAAGVALRTMRRRVNGTVAEHAILLMMAVGRKLCETDGALDFESLRALGYAPAKFDPEHVAGANWARVTGLRALQGATLGALGLGEVGREVATRARAMGMEIVYHQRTRVAPDIEAQSGARYVGFAEMLTKADFLSIHLPLTDATRGMIDAAAFAAMKPGAILTNISRAHIVDRTALVAALDSGRLGGAGLDVHYDEPGDASEPLKAYPNVILSPHIAVAHRSHNMADTAELIANLTEAL